MYSEISLETQEKLHLLLQMLRGFRESIRADTLIPDVNVLFMWNQSLLRASVTVHVKLHSAEASARPIPVVVLFHAEFLFVLLAEGLLTGVAVGLVSAACVAVWCVDILLFSGARSNHCEQTADV